MATQFMTKVNVAKAIARELARVVPPGFTVRDEEGTVVIRSKDSAIGEASYFVDLASQGPSRHAFEIATRNVLNLVQDYISVELRQPWPRAAPDDPEGGGRFSVATPGAIVEGSLLKYWYGPREHPAIEFPPIELGGFQD